MNKFKKPCKNLLFLIMMPLILGGFSCSKENEYTYILENNEFSNLKISNEETNGKVFKPSEVNLTYTINELSKNKDSYASGKYIEATKEIKPKMLVIPVHFNDKDNIEFSNDYSLSKLRNRIDDAFNADSSVNGYYGVKEFYQKSSYGLVDFDFVIPSFYKTKMESKEVDTSYKTNQLIKKILNDDEYLKANDINLKDFDTNSDGFIDSIFLIYDIPDYQTSNKTNTNLWAYTQSSYNVGNLDKPVYSSYSWASYSFLDKGLTENIKNDTHIFIHEIGHQFGLNDYYDYNLKSSPLSGFDMMDYNVIDFNSYSKMIMGWIKPYIVYGEATINEEELRKSNSPVVILKDDKVITKDLNDNVLFNPFNEYLILDYFDYSNDSLNYFDMTNGYSYKGFNKDVLIQKSGYRIFHVDNRMLKINNNVASFYDKDEKISSNKDKLYRVINNTNKGDNKRYESFLISDNKIKFDYDGDIDSLNELTWIAKATENQNNYSSLYIKEVKENNEIIEKLFTPSENYLLNSGDTFDPINYSNYFLNSKKENKIVLDNNETFSTKIVFNY